MSYIEYVEKQSRINRAKFGLTSVTVDEVAAICRYYRRHAAGALAKQDFFALCQGVRNGAEVRAFSRRR